MLEKLKTFIKKFFERQFIRFLFVAGLNTAFGWCIFSLLRFLFGLIPDIDALLFANLFGTIISVLFNFKTYGHLVFRNKDRRLLFKFVLVYIITFFVNYFSIHFLEVLWNINNYWGALIMAVPVGLLNYLLNNLFVFNRKTKIWHWVFMVSFLVAELLFFYYLKSNPGL